MLMFPRSLALIVTTIIFSITETAVGGIFQTNNSRTSIASPAVGGLEDSGASPAVGGLEDSVPDWAWPQPRLLDERSGRRSVAPNAGAQSKASGRRKASGRAQRSAQSKRSVAPNAGVDDLEGTRRVKRARLVEAVAARDGAHESRPEDDLEVTRLVERPRLVEGVARGGAHESSADEDDFLGATRVVKRPQVVNSEEFFGALDVTHKLDLVSDAAEKDGTGVPTPSTLEETVPHDAPLADSAVPSWLLHDSLYAGADEVVDPKESSTEGDFLGETRRFERPDLVVGADEVRESESSGEMLASSGFGAEKVVNEFVDALGQKPVTHRLDLVSDAAEKTGTGVPTPSPLEETRRVPHDFPLSAAPSWLLHDSLSYPGTDEVVVTPAADPLDQDPLGVTRRRGIFISNGERVDGGALCNEDVRKKDTSTSPSSSTTLPPASDEATTSQDPPTSDVTPRANLVRRRANLVRCEPFRRLDLDQEDLPLLLLQHCGRVSKEHDSEIRTELFQDCLDQDLDVTHRLGVFVSDAAAQDHGIQRGVPKPTPFLHDVGLGTLFPLAEENPEDIESTTRSSASPVPSSLGSRFSDVESGPGTHFCGLNFLGPRSTDEDSGYGSSEEQEDHEGSDGGGSSEEEDLDSSYISTAPSDNWDSVSNHSGAVCGPVFSGKRSLWSTCKNFFNLSPFFSL